MRRGDAWGDATEARENFLMETATETARPAGTATRYITVPQWPTIHLWPSKAALRHLIFNAKENGFDACIRRIGRRVLLDEAAVLQWIDEHGRG